MRHWTIYRITHIDSGRVYIGQTGRNPKERYYDHFSSKNTSRHLKFAIQKYGKEAFSWELLASCRTQQDADLTETLLIAEHDSVRNGLCL